MNGNAGVIVGPPGRVVAVAAITVVRGRIREIDIVGDRSKLRQLNLASPDRGARRAPG